MQSPPLTLYITLSLFFLLLSFYISLYSSFHHFLSSSFIYNIKDLKKKYKWISVVAAEYIQEPAKQKKDGRENVTKYSSMCLSFLCCFSFSFKCKLNTKGFSPFYLNFYFWRPLPNEWNTSIVVVMIKNWNREIYKIKQGHFWLSSALGAMQTLTEFVSFNLWYKPPSWREKESQQGQRYTANQISKYIINNTERKRRIIFYLIQLVF